MNCDFSMNLVIEHGFYGGRQAAVSTCYVQLQYETNLLMEIQLLWKKHHDFVFVDPPVN